MVSATRRNLLKNFPLAAVPFITSATEAGAERAQTGSAEKPNIVLIISDQFRADNLGCMGANPLSLTPNLDAMARRGTLFRSAISNQPVCAPARATMFTSLYPGKHGVWKNGFGLASSLPTIASELRKAGYSANYIGKWHLAPNGRGQQGGSLGPVAPAWRGGFLDLWEASNVLELTSHPYEGDLYDGDGRAMHFSNVYRTDFMTGRVQRFLKNVRSPFLLCVSYLEVHHQNDIDAFVPPHEYAGRYKNPFVPQDLRQLPGSWMSQLGDYYDCVAKIDENVGTIFSSLKENNLDKNTIVIFISDHGCHFKTRNAEYKRSPHESSIHIPLIIDGPGFDRALEVRELVSQVDLTPTLLEAAGVSTPSSMQGKSFLPLVSGKSDGWRNEVYFEMHEFMSGRGLRTPQWTYAATAPKRAGWKAVPFNDSYVEYMMYDLYADPFQNSNLSGRYDLHEISAQLRDRLTQRIVEAGDPKPSIEPAWFPYPA